LPTVLQSKISDTAGSIGELLETAEPRGQIARFLHKKTMKPAAAGRPMTEDAAEPVRGSLSPSFHRLNCAEQPITVKPTFRLEDFHLAARECGQTNENDLGKPERYSDEKAYSHS
jgi:hypothetical protein